MTITWKTRWFWVAMIVPVLILISLTVKPLVTYWFGTPVTLKTIPHDPRDLFYGDYVDLRFAISEVKQSQLNPNLRKQVDSRTWFRARPVYVELQPQGSIHTVKQVTEQKPTTSLYLEGTLHPVPSDATRFQIQYPMDQYFVEEGTGKELEIAARKGDVQVLMNVREGYGILVEVK